MPRPISTFRDFKGHKRTVDRLRRQLVGAKARGEPFPHSLFLGPSGVGKTKLAQALADEYGTQVVKVMGYSDQADLNDALDPFGQGDFLFIDEAHRLGSLEQELLMETIDSRNNPIIATTEAPEGERAQPLPSWTLILATDQPGSLVDALVKRIVIQEKLDRYLIAELKEIVVAMAMNTNIRLTAQAAGMIAEASDGLPRRVEHHLLKLRYHHHAAEGRVLGVDEVRQYFAAFEIDSSGLGPIERRYLSIFALDRLEGVDEMKTRSLASLALALGTDSTYTQRQIEGLLARLGLIEIVSSGRRLTQKGKEYVQRLSIVVPAAIEETQNETRQDLASSSNQAEDHGHVLVADGRVAHRNGCRVDGAGSPPSLNATLASTDGDGPASPTQPSARYLVHRTQRPTTSDLGGGENG